MTKMWSSVRGGQTYSFQELMKNMMPVEITAGRMMGRMRVVIIRQWGVKIVTSFIVAYAFVFLRFPGKNILYFVLISTMFIPFTVTMIPN